MCLEINAKHPACTMLLPSNVLPTLLRRRGNIAPGALVCSQNTPVLSFYFQSDEKMKEGRFVRAPIVR